MFRIGDPEPQDGEAPAIDRGPVIKYPLQVGVTTWHGRSRAEFPGTAGDFGKLSALVGIVADDNHLSLLGSSDPT